MSKIAIIGCGPRGLSALENLISEVAYYKPIEIEINIFDPADELGAGQVWNSRQSDANWINISLRALESLPGRNAIEVHGIRIPSFPSFNSWIETEYNIINTNSKDTYLHRSTMGKYLNQRFISISKPLIDAEILKIHKKKINAVQLESDHIKAEDTEGIFHFFDECLLTIGHQKTELDDQMQSWQNGIKDKDLALFTDPYDDDISEISLQNSIIAIRGLGLSTIDIIRKLIFLGGGTFAKDDITNQLKYTSSDSCPKKIVPFSLDGLIAAPKPFNMVIDRIYEPTEKQQTRFEEALIVALDGNDQLSNTDFLLQAFTNSFVEKFSDKFNIKPNEMHKIVADWLRDPSTKHKHILDTDIDLIEHMKALAMMAMSKIEYTLDYAIGQYWRWLQPSMYEIISHSHLSDDLMAEIIEIDEKTKRYSYGPPVESTLQLIALAENGILDLSMVNNPTISLHDSGWQLSQESHKITCNVMINSVLSPPEIKNIKEGPIKSLINNESMDVVSSELGVAIRKDGLILFDNDVRSRISILGRNAKGSVLGVDAILECFGPRISSWAYGVCHRMSNK